MGRDTSELLKRTGGGIHNNWDSQTFRRNTSSYTSLTGPVIESPKEPDESESVTSLSMAGYIGGGTQVREAGER